MTGLQIEVEVSVSTAFAFTPSRIRASCFANSAEPLDEIATNRVVQEIGLDEAEHIEGRRSGHPVQPLGEDDGLDIYH